jgi:hypothetical protein
MKPRHSRQGRLAEVGEEGQRRIALAEAAVRGRGVAAKVEARYLAGAGLGRLVVDDEPVATTARDVDAQSTVTVTVGVAVPDPDPDPAWCHDLHPAARAVATGAHRALRVLRDALENPP